MRNDVATSLVVGILVLLAGLVVNYLTYGQGLAHPAFRGTYVFLEIVLGVLAGTVMYFYARLYAMQQERYDLPALRLELENLRADYQDYKIAHP